MVLNIRSYFFRTLRSRNQNVLVNPDLVYENVVHFAYTASQLGWKGPVVLMSDCTKIRPKAVYSSELGQIVGSVLKNVETKVDSYDDVHRIMTNISACNAIASQAHLFLLKVSKYSCKGHLLLCCLLSLNFVYSF